MASLIGSSSKTFRRRMRSSVSVGSLRGVTGSRGRESHVTIVAMMTKAEPQRNLSLPTPERAAAHAPRRTTAGPQQTVLRTGLPQRTGSQRRPCRCLQRPLREPRWTVNSTHQTRRQSAPLRSRVSSFTMRIFVKMRGSRDSCALGRSSTDQRRGSANLGATAYQSRHTNRGSPGRDRQRD